jgi:hypothetical protein
MGDMFRPLIFGESKFEYNKGIHGEFLACIEDLGGAPSFYGKWAGVKHFSPVNDGVTVQELVNREKSNIIIYYRNKYSKEDAKTGKRRFNFPVVSDQDIGLPVVVVDVDFRWLRGGDSHAGNLSKTASMHFCRHPSDCQFSPNKNVRSLPFSVDPSVYFPVENWPDRQNIGYSGAPLNKDVYSIRKNAVNTVQAIQTEIAIPAKKQAKFYQNVKAAITCNGGQCKYLVAKHFEIMACGAVLFTNGDNGVADYLPVVSYVQYNDDCSDILKKWQDVDNNYDDWIERVKFGANYVLSHHTNVIRIREFVEDINDALGTSFVLNGMKNDSEE